MFRTRKTHTILNKDNSPPNFTRDFALSLLIKFPPYTNDGIKLFPPLDDNVETTFEENIGEYALHYIEGYGRSYPWCIACTKTNKKHYLYHINSLYNDQQFIKLILHRKDTLYINNGIFTKSFTKKFYKHFSNLIFGKLKKPSNLLYSIILMFPPNTVEGRILYRKVEFSKIVGDMMMEDLKPTSMSNEVYSNGRVYDIEMKDGKIYLTDYNNDMDDTYELIPSEEDLYNIEYATIISAYNKKYPDAYTKISDPHPDRHTCIVQILEPNNMGKIIYRMNTVVGIVSYYNDGIIKVEPHIVIFEYSKEIYMQLNFNIMNWNYNTFIIENMILMDKITTKYSYLYSKPTSITYGDSTVI